MKYTTIFVFAILIFAYQTNSNLIDINTLSFFIPVSNSFYYPYDDYIYFTPINNSEWTIYNTSSFAYINLNICSVNTYYSWANEDKIYCLEPNSENSEIYDIVLFNPKTLDINAIITINNGQLFGDVPSVDFYSDYFNISSYIIDLDGNLLCTINDTENYYNNYAYAGNLESSDNNYSIIFSNRSCSDNAVETITIFSTDTLASENLVLESLNFEISASTVILTTSSQYNLAFIISNNTANQVSLPSCQLSNLGKINNNYFYCLNASNLQSLLIYEIDPVNFEPFYYSSYTIGDVTILNVHKSILYVESESDGIVYGIDLIWSRISYIFSGQPYYLFPNGGMYIPSLAAGKSYHLDYWEIEERINPLTVDVYQSYDDFKLYFYSNLNFMSFDGGSFHILYQVEDPAWTDAVILTAQSFNDSFVLVLSLNNTAIAIFGDKNYTQNQTYNAEDQVFFLNAQNYEFMNCDYDGECTITNYEFETSSSSISLCDNSVVKITDTFLACMVAEESNIQLINVFAQGVMQTFSLNPELFFNLNYLIQNYTQNPQIIPFFKDSTPYFLYLQGFFLTTKGNFDFASMSFFQGSIIWPGNMFVQDASGANTQIFQLEINQNENTESSSSFSSNLIIFFNIYLLIIGGILVQRNIFAYKNFNPDSILVKLNVFKEEKANKNKSEILKFNPLMGKIEFLFFSLLIYFAIVSQTICGYLVFEIDSIVASCSLYFESINLSLDYPLKFYANVGFTLFIALEAIQILALIGLTSSILQRRMRIIVCFLTLGFLQIVISTYLESNNTLYNFTPFYNQITYDLFYSLKDFITYIYFILAIWAIRYALISENDTQIKEKFSQCIEDVKNNGTNYKSDEKLFDFCDQRGDMKLSYRNIAFVGSVFPTLVNLIFAKVPLAIGTCSIENLALDESLCLGIANYESLNLEQSFFNSDGQLFGAFGLFIIIVSCMLITRTVLILHRFRAKFIGIQAIFVDNNFWIELIEDIGTNFVICYVIFFQMLDPDLIGKFSQDGSYSFTLPSYITVNTTNPNPVVNFNLTVSSGLFYTPFTYAVLLISLYTFIYHSKNGSLLNFYTEEDLITLAKKDILTINHDINNPYNESLELIRLVYKWFPNEKPNIKAQACLKYFDQIGYLSDHKVDLKDSIIRVKIILFINHISLKVILN